MFFPRKEQGENAEPGPLTRHIRINRKALEGLFHLKLKDAAREIGLCPTTFKKACRRCQIEKWPSRIGQRDAAFARRSAQTDDAITAWRETSGLSFSSSSTASSTPTASPTKLPLDYRATSSKLPLDYPDAFGAVFPSASCISIGVQGYLARGVPVPEGQPTRHPNGLDGLTTWHEETQAFLTGSLKETWNEETPGFWAGTRKEGYGPEQGGAAPHPPPVSSRPPFGLTSLETTHPYNTEHNLPIDGINNDLCFRPGVAAPPIRQNMGRGADLPPGEQSCRVTGPPFSNAFWANAPFEDVFERVNNGDVPSAAGEPPGTTGLPRLSSPWTTPHRGSGPGEQSCLEAVMAYLDGPLARNFDFIFDEDE